MISEEAKYIRQRINMLKVGQFINVEERMFRVAYPCGWLSIYRTHIEAFLSQALGSAWGAWQVIHDPDRALYCVSRHKEGDHRVYVDPDREHLFKRKNGYLVPK